MIASFSRRRRPACAPDRVRRNSAVRMGARPGRDRSQCSNGCRARASVRRKLWFCGAHTASVGTKRQARHCNSTGRQANRTVRRLSPGSTGTTNNQGRRCRPQDRQDRHEMETRQSGRPDRSGSPGRGGRGDRSGRQAAQTSDAPRDRAACPCWQQFRIGNRRRLGICRQEGQWTDRGAA